MADQEINRNRNDPFKLQASLILLEPKKLICLLAQFDFFTVTKQEKVIKIFYSGK